ncbi:DUF418 domain-containing protein [Nonomuraea dietziae]|uniref:DUF418 domain-containing protein n=1 Tax=Nonomuraea dietziae TaxID=65515 RepID=A0A7W5YNV0_9ACTN|nr:DUF418 domain-containing protein [Nonomuraea dietziae]MBB3724374.1 uncharacterized protein [Nonomuraea dietziae]
MTAREPTRSGAPPLRRVHEVDTIRGFALAGILLANIGFFADPRLLATVGMGTTGPVDFAVQTLILSKFYVIFSFLFGYSFTLQTRSAESVGAGVTARTLRRCLGLLVIGLLHGLLLWPGEILTLYAALGLVLLALRRVRPRTAVITAIVLLVVVCACYALLALLVTCSPTPVTVMAAPSAEEGARVLAAFTGGPLDVLGVNLSQYLHTAPMVWFAQGPGALAMFLLGLAAGKSRLFERPGDWAHRAPAVQWIGFTVGLPTAVLYSVLIDHSGVAMLAATALNTLTSPLLAAAYVVTLLRLARRFPSVPAALTPAGRAAASNYLGQSVLACLVFSGYGLGLAGRIPPLGVVAIAVAMYAVLLALSAWWLREHRYGPVEHLLRRLTEGRRHR